MVERLFRRFDRLLIPLDHLADAFVRAALQRKPRVMRHDWRPIRDAFDQVALDARSVRTGQPDARGSHEIVVSRHFVE